MTQKFIRRFSGFNRFQSFINWIWLKAANPKLWTITVCVTYVLLIIGWIPAMVQPPSSLEGVIGEIAMYVIAVLIVTGSAVGIFAAFWGIFKVERWSVLSVAIGIMMYVAIVYSLHWTTEGNRLPQAQTIAALLPAFIARFVHVTTRSSADDDELLVDKRPVD